MYLSIFINEKKVKNFLKENNAANLTIKLLNKFEINTVKCLSYNFVPNNYLNQYIKKGMVDIRHTCLLLDKDRALEFTFENFDSLLIPSNILYDAISTLIRKFHGSLYPIPLPMTVRRIKNAQIKYLFRKKI